LHRLRVFSLSGQAAAAELECQGLISRFEASPDPVERTRIADEYSHALRRLESLKLLVAIVEQKEEQPAELATH
jgi:hypothetical protein